MKYSKYNHFLSSPRYGEFIYNAVTNSFVKIAAELRARIEAVKVWNEDALRTFPEDFRKVLLDHRIIVPDDFDEEYYLKKKYAKLSFQSSPFQKGKQEIYQHNKDEKHDPRGDQRLPVQVCRFTHFDHYIRSQRPDALYN